MNTEFVDYVYEFYNDLYPEYNFTKQEVISSTEYRMSKLKYIKFDDCSFDRELVRDIIFKMRDPNSETEYDVKAIPRLGNKHYLV